MLGVKGTGCQGTGFGDHGRERRRADKAGQQTDARAEIERCEKDPSERLKMLKLDLPEPAKRTKGPRYTPVAKRQDKPDAIAWLLRHHPELKESQIAKLIGTTKNTIQAVGERTHWNSPNIRPRDPVLLGLCSQGELNVVIERARQQAAKSGQPIPQAAPYVETTDDPLS